MPQVYTFYQFQQDYPDDNACLNKIMELRYGSEPRCDECKRITKSTESQSGGPMPASSAGRTSIPA